MSAWEDAPYTYYEMSLPYGEVYPFARRELDVALGQAGVTGAVAAVHYYRRPPLSVVLGVRYTGEAAAASNGGEGRSTITFYSVPIAKREIVAELLRSQAVPAICQWLQSVIVAHPDWRCVDHVLSYRVWEGKLALSERDPTARPVRPTALDRPHTSTPDAPHELPAI